MNRRHVYPLSATWPGRDAPGRILICAAVLAGWAAGGGGQDIAGGGTLTLDQALDWARNRNPGLEAASHDRLAADARVRQAGRLPNPELELELEEYDRDGEGFDSSEAVLTVGQAIELGGKRRARVRQAQLARELANWERARARLDVDAETRIRFTDALAAQSRADLADAAVELAENAARVVDERVKAGREPQLQATKARAELALTRMDARDARRELAAARRQLAAMWGAEKPGFGALAGDLHRQASAVPALADLQDQLAGTPDLARWDTVRRIGEADAAAARAARIPDLEASIGFQRFEEDGSDALAFGVGIPLPLFNRNQDEIAAAAHEQAGTDAAYRAATLAHRAAVAEAHDRLTSSRARADILGDQVVPAMEAAFAAAEEGYRQGKLGYLDVLDAQRSLAEARRTQLDALAAYHHALTRIDRLTAQPTLTKEN